MPSEKTLDILFNEALDRRKELFLQLESERTDCWRIFNGSTEGFPGLTVDRYGPFMVVQLFFGSLTADNMEFLQSYAEKNQLEPLLLDKKLLKSKRISGQDNDKASIEKPPLTFHMPCDHRFSSSEHDWEICREQGQYFYISRQFKGMDPYFYLDFRAARRWLRENVNVTMKCLNLFSYTCTAGVAAAANGGYVVNADFGNWCLQVGRRNAQLNHLPKKSFHYWKEDIFPVLWQLSGLGIKGKAARRHYLRIEKQKFDVIILDPPTSASTPYGKVDLVNDYAAMLKPCFLSLNPNGCILATNHAADVTKAQWEKGIYRTAEKIGQKIASVEYINPESDFPSFDGEHPLKIALIRMG